MFNLKDLSIVRDFFFISELRVLLNETFNGVTKFFAWRKFLMRLQNFSILEKNLMVDFNF